MKLAANYLGLIPASRVHWPRDLGQGSCPLSLLCLLSCPPSPLMWNGDNNNCSYFLGLWGGLKNPVQGYSF